MVSLILSLAGRFVPKSVAGIIASTGIFCSFLVALALFGNTLSSGFQPYTVNFAPWFSAGDLHVDFAFQVDQLSVLMLLIITGVGFLIHIYSIGYMHHDEGFNRFMSYLNLFVFFMLLLVMGANYLILFIGWEGVGLCSYLLIGFWYKNQEYNNAARKAFVMNRIGDLGLLLGMFFTYYTFGTLNYTEVFAKAAVLPYGDNTLTLITILLFIGATGKSAQIPLYTWLPNAMAGPTPVSALIHAATMVTAGIYLIIRSNVLYTLAPVTQTVILVIGLATAVFAATIGLKQNDIKKVLAYSTVSQLGYMFIALGVGAYTAAFFHLLTHAFFKALLFLGSGSVIHAMSGEQDIRNMGGLKKHLPITHITFLIGCLAISGIPVFAGFFSKDEIPAGLFAKNPALWGIGILGSLMTAFYMFRLYFLTFHGKFRGTHEQEHHLHESPASMTVPLIILAVLSTIGGFIGLPVMLGENAHKLKAYFAPLFQTTNTLLEQAGVHAHHLSHATEWALMGASVGLVLIVIFICRSVYVGKQVVPAADSKERGFGKVLSYKYYIDELYDTLIGKLLPHCQTCFITWLTC